jgi:enamine deaminase RidA (YjgF/YER057c/UK114 family)
MPNPLPEAIVAPDAPPPAGHYAAGVRAGGFIYVSGQLPVAVDRTPRADLDFADQARLALANMLAVVRAGGGSPAGIVKVTAEHWPAFNAVYAEVMGEARPARVVVPVPELHHGCLVEVEAIAVVEGADA